MKDRDKPALRILIVDDEPSVRDSLSKWFREFDYHVESAPDAVKTLKMARPGRWDVALLDIKLPGMDGTELQRRIKEIDSDVTTIMITAFASVDTAVKSLKDGADDYITKPIDPEYLALLISKISDRKNLRSENIRLKETIQELYEFDQIIGKSPAISRVHDLIRAVAPTDTTVLIRGESGTGYTAPH